MHCFSEQQFFLRSFQGSSVAVVCTGSVAGTGSGSGGADPVGHLYTTALELARHGVRVLLFYAGHSAPARQLESRFLSVAPVAAGIGPPVVIARHVPVDGVAPQPLDVWHRVQEYAGTQPDGGVHAGGLVLLVPMPDTLRADPVGWQRVLLPCRFSRVLLLDEAGGLSDTAGRLLHFVNARRLQRLLREPDPAAGSGTVAPGLRRRWVLELVHTLLAHGVLAISLCRMADLEQELFTYQGCGTFFSHNHYCTVRRLAWDDLPTAAALVRHGEQEGYLLPRSEADRLEILLSGYGAFLGGTHPAGAQLAGLCGLLTAPYAGERAGEVVTLYTLTRFQGGGIGDHLVREIRRIGRQQGLRSLFACTRDPRVGAFFVRHGFVHVAPDALPAAKWHHYDPARKAGIMALQLTWHETRRPGR